MSMEKNLSYKNTYIIDTTTHTGSTLSVNVLYDYYKMSGGTTITGLTGGTVGQQVCLELLDDTTFTHSATLILPGAKDLEGTDGNIYRFARTSSTAWTCIGNSILGGGGSMSGDVTVDTLTLTDGQVKFPSTQNASSNVNTLDDYEEGTYTPTIGCSSGGGYTVNASYPLSYNKIGRMVTLYGTIYITADNSANGQIMLTMPFTNNVYEITGMCALLDTDHANTGNMRITCGAASTILYLTTFDTYGIITYISSTDVDSAWKISVNFSYNIS